MCVSLLHTVSILCTSELTTKYLGLGLSQNEFTASLLNDLLCNNIMREKEMGVGGGVIRYVCVCTDIHSYSSIIAFICVFTF